MSTFFRGPVCGTDNCRSRLWRIIDGRRTCQYGHVMEGDVEFNDDEDDINSMGVITRRLNLTTNATGSFRSSMNSQSQLSQKEDANQKVYGAEGERLFLRCFQYILKLQCTWLIEHQNFPPVFTDVVKLMWMRFIRSLEIADQRSATGDDNGGTSMQVPGKKPRLSLLSSICLLYMANTHLRMPVHSCDYIRWICSMKLVYFKANLHLPALWRKQLPNYYHQVLEGGKTPSEGQFFHKLAHMCFAVQLSSCFSTYVSYEALTLKLLFAVKLPPQILFDVKELIRISGESDSSFCLYENHRERVERLYQCSDLRIAAYFILAVRYKILQDDPFFVNYCLAWLEIEGSEDSPAATEDLVTKLSHDAASLHQNNHRWSDQQTTDYLDWMEQHFLPASTKTQTEAQTIDHRIASKKLYSMFPLEKAPTGSAEDRATRPSYVDKTQEAYLEISDALAHGVRVPRQKQTPMLAQLAEAKLLREISYRFAVSQPQLRECLGHLQSRICKTRNSMNCAS
ncbi:Rrn7p [Lachancea thermotolerans CBS 6340]|uniref:KLTH0B03828p n=1 Tax=Lachancea thermotolerans (strain ATCC 56472 / CBS 6340 / NRRL Y-8284) TaxID=559295 RepID=C5DCK6_LACTC|nr:KLTH0B03828p [Lachancea thermotolerans CBS 6340]CAR21517.1 KLTH0B03828p [Lachancea thermotolerans CBS 6340]